MNRKREKSQGTLCFTGDVVGVRRREGTNCRIVGRLISTR